MRKFTLTNVLLSAALMFGAIGCIDPELDADAMDSLAKDKAPAVVPACDFGSAEIVVGTPYTVSIVYDKLDTKKTYLVEVSLAGTLQSQNANVAQKGLMRVPVTPQKAGQGAIAVYETKIKKDKVEKKLATQCSFVAQERPVVDDPVDDDPIDDDPIDDDPIDDDPIDNDPIDDDPASQACNSDAQCAAGQVCSNKGTCANVPSSCASTVDFFKRMASSVECGQFRLADYAQCAGLDYTIHFGTCTKDQFCNKNLKCESYSTCELKTCEQLSITCSLMCSNTYLGCGQYADCCYRLGDGVAAPSKADWPTWEKRVMTLINQHRAQGAFCADQWYAPVPALAMIEGSNLWLGARQHAEYMAFYGYAHAQTLPPGTGENIARGQMSAESVVDAWIESEGHCKNIMHPRVRSLGVGLYYRDVVTRDGYFWVSRFQL